ncbi:MAG: GGDEF domain-containing protein [Myxococcales bacterium]|nr:GGDEF domain-containing protein [Myxococcales bacterium]
MAALAAVRAQRARRLRERLDADALTGLMRRRGFLEALTRSLAACARSARSLALVLCAVDHFKAINDRYGHESGDHVLAAFGRLLAKSFRAQDLRGRWGGEEFILAFPGETAESVRQPIEAAFRALAEMPLFDWRKRAVHRHVQRRSRDLPIRRDLHRRPPARGGSAALFGETGRPRARRGLRLTESCTLMALDGLRRPTPGEGDA